MPRRSLALLLSLLAPAASCTGDPARAAVPVDADPPAARPVAEPWFTPAATQPAARPATADELRDWVPGDVLPAVGEFPTVVFAAHRDDSHDTHPGIFVVTPNGGAALIDLGALEEFAQARFDRVEVSHDRARIWAIADTVVESRSWQLQIVHSGDGGRTWRVAGSLRKPYYMAELHDLRIDARGRGALVVRWIDDPAAPISGAPPGHYTYRTDDGGATWSAPEYAADDLSDRSIREPARAATVADLLARTAP